ncbi:hypothetical protein HMPREF9015_01452 [Leptotrichia wadei F0279]|uniref:Uncharacterized protein n=1 Tax=Leptotrichia wadei (strain F0279) TaxID=888055 RepID=U2PFD5_LEPWF|nr:hypothetical protein HMPREF9015_01452 [Leptotrichia wadei F0279]
MLLYQKKNKKTNKYFLKNYNKINLIIIFCFYIFKILFLNIAFFKLKKSYDNKIM